MNSRRLTPKRAKYAILALHIFALFFVSACRKDAATTPEQPSLDNLNTTASTAAATSTYKLTTPVSLYGAKNITISGDSIIGGTKPCISLTNCSNIHITHCKLMNSKSFGIILSNCTAVMIDNSYISNVITGVYAVDSKTIQVEYNQMKNMTGPLPHGQFVQFDNVTGGYNRVMYNKCENIAGASNPEDAISMYKSSGLANDPIFISGNWIRGGGPSHSGGGIMLGDNGGSYQVAQSNILVDPGQYGMAVAGGTNMQIINNSIYARKQAFTNVGIYDWNQSGKASSAVTISGNKVNFTNSSGSQNSDWLGSGTATPTGWKSNAWGANINAYILPTKIITY